MDDSNQLCLQIKENAEAIQEKISDAAKRSGRNAGDVKLITVSKKKIC